MMLFIYGTGMYLLGYCIGQWHGFKAGAQAEAKRWQDLGARIDDLENRIFP